MKTFEKKARDIFGEILINKSLIHKAGFGNRAIPIYVGEWIIAHYLGNEDTLTKEGREKIAKFVQKYAPPKGQREAVKNRLFEQDEIQILDNFSVYVNLDKGNRYLNVPFLDVNAGFLSPRIIQDNEMLLSSGLWGVGTLFYIPPSEEGLKGQVWMKEFKPFQLANVDIEYFSESRSHFTTDEWIDLIVSSMGFNHEIYSKRQKILLICRLIPMVEPRFSLVEPAPKGTGKSFVFDNMSRYVATRSGSISPAVLFFNDARKTPGLITRYDSVVIDEAQKVKADNSGELTALLKSYLESGRFGRGTASSISAEAGLVLLANIDMDENKKPLNIEIGIFRLFPNFLRETAFIDRFSGLLPGWYLPRVTKNTPSKNLGFKGDIFGEILHTLRDDIGFKDYIKIHMTLQNCEDMRDTKAIEAGASGLLKIIFPDKNPSEEDFYIYCVNPAVELRQGIRDELCKLDREYISYTIYSQYPDEFQMNHKPPRYVDVEGEEFLSPVESSSDTSTDPKELETNEEEDIAAILEALPKVESETVEFKSSLRWSYTENRCDKKLQLEVIKTVAGFMNTRGGKLYIGIQDDGGILGIKNDLTTVSHKNQDGFLHTLYTVIGEAIGRDNSAFIETEFLQVADNKICVVTVNTSNEPIFVKDKTKHSSKFLVRNGTTTVELDPKETLKYIGKKWPKSGDVN